MSDIRDFAIKAHGTQQYGDQPYVVHLDQVWAVLQEHGYTDSFYRQGAYIHDIIEDCTIKEPDGSLNMVMEQRLEEAVGYSPILMYVAKFCTDEEGPNRKTRKALTYERCRRQIIQDYRGSIPFPSVPIAVRVKVADRLANLRNCLATKSDLIGMYRKERQAFRDALYVAGMCDSMWAEYDRLLGG